MNNINILTFQIEDKARTSIQPSYAWAPWINPEATRSTEVFNSEFRKAPEWKNMGDQEHDDKDLSQEFLIELLNEADVCILSLILILLFG